MVILFSASEGQGRWEVERGLRGVFGLCRAPGARVARSRRDLANKASGGRGSRSLGLAGETLVILYSAPAGQGRWELEGVCVVFSGCRRRPARGSLDLVEIQLPQNGGERCGERHSLSHSLSLLLHLPLAVQSHSAPEQLAASTQFQSPAPSSVTAQRASPHTPLVLIGKCRALDNRLFRPNTVAL